MPTIPQASQTWDADGATVLYAAPHAEDAVPMIEIRANVTESGWDTIAFIDAAWPTAKDNARLIARLPQLLDALLNVKHLAEKSGDDEAEPFTLLDLIGDEVRAVLAKTIAK